MYQRCKKRLPKKEKVRDPLLEDLKKIERAEVKELDLLANIEGTSLFLGLEEDGDDMDLDGGQGSNDPDISME
jgi:hypothetical protein